MAFGRLKAFAALLVLAAALNGMSLTDAERTLDGRNKSEIFRAYDTFKGAYMQALAKNDAALEKRALEGIVKSGELLHIDVNAYKNKLRKVPAAVTKRAPAAVAKRVPAPAPSVKTELPAVRGGNRLKDVRWEEGKLVFRFKKALKKRDVNYFILKKTKKKGYRYVFDIHAALDRSHTLTHRDLKRITLAQYKPSTLRLVLESDRKLPVRFSKTGNRLVISAGLAGITSPKSVPSAVAAVPPSKGKVIVIDPGHGGKDCGAVGYRNYQEKDIVLAIAAKTAARLRARGYTVHMTRSSDRFIKLRKRTHFANRKKADLFISIHANAVPKRKIRYAYGLETYFLSPSRSTRATNAAALENKTEVEDMNFYAKNVFLNALNSEKIVASHKLAIDLQSSILSSLRARYGNVKDGGVREGPFWVLVGAQMPAVLVEVGFITHPTEGARLHSKSYQDYFARGLAEGVDRYFAKNP
jgi:N-acetylmuramoyl-L-alanine amidase